MNGHLRCGSEAVCHNGLNDMTANLAGMKTMTAQIKETGSLIFRIAVVASVLMAPVAAFAYSQGNASASGAKGAGFVLYVSLQRNGVTF